MMAPSFLARATPPPGGRTAIIVLLGLIIPACISLRITTPPEPECVLDAVAIVRTDPRNKNLKEPLVDEPLTASDASAYSVIKILQVNKPLVLQWLWYAPDNLLVRRSQAVVINARGRYLTYAAAWDMLARRHYAEKKGNWTVVITAGGSFLARKEFAVN
jgi:hypothetical protein